ncbi:hypothetical protein [uncultured Eudoraea sp.]|uniref:hypothetical protein n=1 Tax=uncultured Eudoraea sp. TaxID=1035614 RepID=UPI0026102B18|nr:hypothetical protein [uncultured Eudoraea sp.]
MNYSSGIQENPEFDTLENEVRRVTNINFQNKLREEWYGITWAYPVNEKLGIGASLFGSIYTNEGGSDIDITVEREDSSTAGYSSTLNYNQKTYGLFLKMGVAWQISNIELGANLNLPFIPVETRAFVKKLLIVLELSECELSVFQVHFTNISLVIACKCEFYRIKISAFEL